MSRLALVLVVLTGLAAGSLLSSASALEGRAAAKKCKKNYTLKKGKCVKKKAPATALKDGDYTYKQIAVGSAPVNTLTISGNGTKIRIREMFFSGGVDPAERDCAPTMIDFGTLKLTRMDGVLMWTTGAKFVTVPPVQTEGVNGGRGTTSGQIDPKTLEVYVNTNVTMKNRNNGSGCGEGHSSEDPQKLKRK